MAARSRSSASGGDRVPPSPPSVDELDRMLIKEKAGHLLSVRDLAIGAGMLTVFLIAFGQTKFRPAVEELLKGSVSWSFVLYLSTVASLILLGIFWYAHGTDELEILENWLRPSRFKFHTKKRQYLTIFAVGITLPLMAVYSDFIAIFAICFTGYLLVDLWAWKVRREEIGRAVEGSKRSLAAYRDRFAAPGQHPRRDRGTRLSRVAVFEQAANDIDRYYRGRLHYTRLVVEIALMGMAAIMAVLLHVADASVGHQSAVAVLVYRLANQFGGTPEDARQNLRILFFCCFLVMFWGSELVIHRWRRAMYAALAPLDDRRAALEQDTR